MKVGGLGDVVTSLSRAVQDLGHNVEIILPKYDCINFNLVSSTVNLSLLFQIKFFFFILIVN
jgi:glycogen synthase